MSTHKNFDRLCCLALACCLLLTLLMSFGETLGLQAASNLPEYASRLFSTDVVHTIDIAIDDWEGFLQTAQSETYSVCDVTIDGELFRSAGIRGKGNTSLSTVASMDSDRYSFKIEFDQYDSALSYYGLDKLCLNNLIQDNTMMKDYLTYQMMNAFGAAAPLCSFVWITVNGEPWGLYLAVEAVEDSFLQRNYGSNHGELYKPDSMSMGGGRGNGRDFNMEDWQQQNTVGDAAADRGGWQRPDTGSRLPFGETGTTRPQTGENNGSGMENGFKMPVDGFDFSQLPQMPEGFDPDSLPEGFDAANRGGKGGFGGMGSSDVKLQYMDDDPNSYANIFDSAKTTVTEADKTRLIRSLQALGQGDSAAVDTDSLLRYFVVHNYVVNGDSYTGNMVHNYYLYEENGQLSMLPWDYNLAFGSFQNSSASGAVNDAIDAPLSCSGNGDRPMMDLILQNSQLLSLYHRYFADFLDSVDIQGMIAQAAALIAPYVAQDPTAFCSYEEHLAGVAALKTFCSLRSQSVQAQLAGDSTPVDTGDLDLSALGSMNMGGMGKGDRGNHGQGNRTQTAAPSDDPMNVPETGAPVPAIPQDFPVDGFGGQMPVSGASGAGIQNVVPSGSSLALPGVSAAVLLIGLLIVWKYRR